VEKKENLINEFVPKDNQDSKSKKAVKSESEKSQTKEKESYSSTRVTTNNEGAIEKTVLDSIPKESQVTTAKFEGPNIALYTKNPKFSLTELTFHLSYLSKNLKKRFVIRTDPSIRLSEDKTRSVVGSLLPKDVLVSAVFCDDALGEVILEVNKPEAIDGNMVIEIAQSTGWIAHTRRSPHIPSSSISTIHSILKTSAKERIIFLDELGSRIFRSPLILGDGSDNALLIDTAKINKALLQTLI
jgi:predicted metal-dependent RNase